MQAMSPSDPREIVEAWREAGLERWFAVDSLFDERMRLSFQANHFAAARDELSPWATAPESALALLILLDQIPRNIFRGTAHMFATDQIISLARRRPLGPRIGRKAAGHLDIIARFGRFPHRNAMLGRNTTVEEQAYLDQGGFAG